MSHRTNLAMVASALAVFALTGCEPASSSGPAPVQAASLPPAPPAAVELQVPRGTLLSVRLNHSVGTKSSHPGDRFSAVLAQTITVDDHIVLPRGSEVSGTVRECGPSGRLKGRAVVSLVLDRIDAGGNSYVLSSAPITRVSAGHKKRNWSLIGGGSGVGALIGGLAGGGTGALIGAGAGAAAGTAGAALSGQRHLTLPPETLLEFRLLRPLTVRTALVQPARERA
jgi:hypothetical protein